MTTMTLLQVRMHALMIFTTLVQHVHSDCFVSRDDAFLPDKGTGDLGEDQITQGTTEVDPDSRRPTCAGLFFDSFQHTCCGDVINRFVAKFHDPNIRCCGTVAFDSSRKFCCQAGRPLLGKKQAGKLCCGTRFIDPATQICCNGKAAKKAPNMKCCDKDSYDPDREICCRLRGGRLVARPGNACCNGRAFDNTDPQRFCCDGRLRRSSSTASMRCCGIAVYDFNKHLCCGRRKMSKRYSPALFTCCADNRVKSDTSVGCCNANLYNTVLNQCCDGKVVPK